MPDQRAKRRLRAILSADAVGYSRLMGQDEAGAITAIKSLRQIVSDAVDSYGGRVVDSPGDNILAEFSSTVDAVRCAAVVQRRIGRLNRTIPEDRRLIFRMGIHLGDIVFDEGRIYGNGVNLAARIEGLAAPGGVSVSREVYEQVKKKTDLVFADQGEHRVKNIPEPVRVYRLLLDEAPDQAAPGRTFRPPTLRHGKGWIAGTLALLALSAGAYLFFEGPFPFVRDTGDTASLLSTEGKPAIAVLPFDNLAGDTADDYFIDGMTNDIITDLSKFKELLVIAGNTMFTYRGKNVDARELGRELNVRYILEGSVQKAGTRVRINAQLIDAESGHHLWAERFDREMADIFALQDELVKTIVGRLAIRIDESEARRTLRKSTENLQAYDYLLRGRQLQGRNTVDDVRRAREMYRKALELDPRYAAAYTETARTYYWEYLYGTLFPDQTLDLAEQYARKALELDEFEAGAHAMIGSVDWRRGRFDAAISRLRRAVELNPNDAMNQNRLGTALLYAGFLDESIKWKESSFRLDPRQEPGTNMNLALAYYLKGRYSEAVASIQTGLSDYPDYLGYHLVLAATYAMMDRPEEASDAASKVLHLDPFFETARYGTAFRNASDRETILNGLRKAGLP